MKRIALILCLAACALLLAACGGNGGTEAAPAATAAPTAAPTTAPTEVATEAATEAPTEAAAEVAATEVTTETAEAAEAAAPDLPDFGAAVFSDSSAVTNRFFPLTPGTRFVYEGTTIEDDGTSVPHRVEIVVTDLTKVIGGVRSVATWDLDFSDDELVEEELAFYAQDDAGNVWRMGEFPVEYDAGEIVGAPTWMHGFQDAQAGIHMPADPQPGTPSYAQGWGPAVGWTDRGQVDEIGAESCVPVDCYTDVLVIAETSAAEPDAQQLKFFAPGVGNIRVGWRGAGEKTKESLELAEYVQLSSEEMAAARDKALALEDVGYEISPDVYAQTEPLEQ